MAEEFNILILTFAIFFLLLGHNGRCPIMKYMRFKSNLPIFLSCIKGYVCKSNIFVKYDNKYGFSTISKNNLNLIFSHFFFFFLIFWPKVSGKASLILQLKRFVRIMSSYSVSWHDSKNSDKGLYIYIYRSLFDMGNLKNKMKLINENKKHKSKLYKKEVEPFKTNIHKTLK